MYTRVGSASRHGRSKMNVLLPEEEDPAGAKDSGSDRKAGLPGNEPHESTCSVLDNDREDKW